MARGSARRCPPTSQVLWLSQTSIGPYSCTDMDMHANACGSQLTDSIYLLCWCYFSLVRPSLEACKPRRGAGERAARARKGPPSTLLYMIE